VAVGRAGAGGEGPGAARRAPAAHLRWLCAPAPWRPSHRTSPCLHACRPQALWAGYRGDAPAQLRHLLDAGDARAAHAVFCSAVAPALFLEASAASASELARLAARLSEAQAAIGPAWGAGGGLYHAWCRLFVAADAGADGSAVALPAPGGKAGPGGGCAWRRDVVAEAAAAGGGALTAVAEAAAQLAQQLVAAGGGGGGKAGGGATVGGGGAAAAAARRALHARMSADAGRVLARVGAAAAGGDGAPAAHAALQQGCAALSAHAPVLLAGLAVL
jgi:hypothetical protein